MSYIALQRAVFDGGIGVVQTRGGELAAAGVIPEVEVSMAPLKKYASCGRNLQEMLTAYQSMLTQDIENLRGIRDIFIQQDKQAIT